jgi:TRAP-type C4-dicarboxylate transport system permease small subunit
MQDFEIQENEHSGSISSSLPAPKLAASLINYLETSSRWINRIVEYVTSLLLSLMVIAVFTQVIFRYVIQSSLSWSEELARYTFVWAIFLGASVATRRGQHIVMDAVTSLFPTKINKYLSIFVSLGFIAFAVLLIVVGVILVEAVRFQVVTGLQISIAWIYAALPVGASVIVLHLVCILIQEVRAISQG